MTHAEFLALARDACEESKLHASYTFTPAKFKAAAFAVDAVLIGVRERLATRQNAKRPGRKRLRSSDA